MVIMLLHTCTRNSGTYQVPLYKFCVNVVMQMHGAYQNRASLSECNPILYSYIYKSFEKNTKESLVFFSAIKVLLFLQVRELEHRISLNYI